MADSFTEMTDEVLVHRTLQLERDLVSARFKHSMSQLQNTASLRVLRRDIARLRTEARRRERDEGLQKDSLLSKHRVTFRAAESDGTSTTQEEGGGFLSGIVDKLTGKEST